MVDSVSKGKKAEKNDFFMTLGSKYIMPTNERKKSTYFYKKKFLGFSPISGPISGHDPAD